jgi:hypothetical protein
MTSLELLEHRALEELGTRAARVIETTPSMAIVAITGSVELARAAHFEDDEPWMSIATVALKQAIMARQAKEYTS